VALSSSGRLVVAPKSDHQIMLYEPDLVVNAIRDVVNEARARVAKKREQTEPKQDG